MTKEKEKVIFRKENKLFNGIQYYLAIFPDDPANPGRLSYVSFFFCGDEAIFESFGEADYWYCMTKTRVVHKNDSLSKRLIESVEKHYEIEVQQMEKVMR